MSCSNKTSIVVGSGISGMTMALLLASLGRNVIMLEKSRVIGGLTQRFYRQGVGFDTGFHFTSGFDLLLPQMLRFLNIDDMVKEREFCTKIYSQKSGKTYQYPNTGIDDVQEYLVGCFPQYAKAIREYFAAEKAVIDSTPMFNLWDENLFNKLQLTKYDLASVDDFLDDLKVNEELRMIFSSVALCHGSAPKYAPFSHHARVGYGLENHISQIHGGGGALVEAFKREAKRLNIQIHTNVDIKSIKSSCNGQFDQVELQSGDVFEFDDIFMAIHPKSICAMLPEGTLSERITQAIDNYEESCGFFSIYGVMASDTHPCSELTSFVTSCDVNKMLCESSVKHHATGMIVANETTKSGEQVQTFTAFSSVNASETAKWNDLKTAEYQDYKAEKIRAILDEVYEVYPHFKDKLQIVDSASMLTFRDYVQPTGSAYGVMRKIDEPRLFGRLPIRKSKNIYGIGQNALIPGIVGGMVSAFLLFRQMAGEDRYFELLKERLS